MSQPPGRAIRKANPGTFQSDREVIRQFVVRTDELSRVMEVLSDNADASSCQHILVVAPRGRGKTMLLARVAAELRTRDVLGRRLLPVRFMEESHEVFDLADFWLECLFFLARESAVRDRGLRDELRATHAALAARPRGEELIESRARAAVLDAADRLGRKLVFMVENLQDLCGDVDDDFGWKLREALQSQPEIMLLATATSRFAELDDVTQPFFGLFRIVALEPLNPDECRRLWKVVSGEAVDADEIKPLKILTGGSPRLLVFLADFARHGSLLQLMEQLVRLVDDHTEYFRTYLDGLAKTERRVYLSILDLWQPSTASEIAGRSRLDIRVVSTMLGRLVRRGTVIFEGTGRKRRYSAAERLYGFYYKLRRERDGAAFVSNLVLFMAALYRKHEVAPMTERLRIDAAQAPAIRAGIKRAFVEVARQRGASVGEKLFAARLISADASVQAELGDPAAAIASYEAVIERLGASESPELQVQVAAALFDKACMQGGGGDLAAEVAGYDEIVSRYGASDVHDLRVYVAQSLLYKGLALTLLHDLRAAVAAHDVVVKRFAGSTSLRLQVTVALALGGKGIVQRGLGDREGEIATCDEIIGRYQGNEFAGLKEQVAEALVNKGVAHEELGDSVAAIAAYDEVVRRYAASGLFELQEQVAQSLINKGVVQGQLGDSMAEIATYDECVRRFGASELPELQLPVAMALVNKGVTRGQLGDSTAALAAFDEVVRRHGASEEPRLQKQVALALVNIGDAQSQLGDLDAAIDVGAEVVRRYGASELPELQGPVAAVLVNRGAVQLERGDADTALDSYGEVVRRYGASELPELQEQVARALMGRGVANGDLGNFEAAVAAFDEVARRYGASETPELQIHVASALLNKGLSHSRGGHSEAAISAWEEVAGRYATTESPELQADVGRALLSMGLEQIHCGRTDDAVCTCEALERLSSTPDRPRDAALVWRTMGLRTNVLLAQGESAAALELFGAYYATIPIDDEFMRRDVIELVIDLVVSGASERSLLGILTSDRDKADALAPLVVALRKRAGGEVRAPVEVIEVAADILKELEEVETADGGKLHAPAR